MAPKVQTICEMNNTLFVGNVFICLDKVDSTNNYALNLLKNVPPPVEGTTIYALEQYAGRGQRGSEWAALPGENITTSVILCPRHLLATQQFVLSQLIALAVRNFVAERVGEGVKIKWPNDIYYQNNKIGGILIENTVSGNKLANSVVGIGINVNQTIFDPKLPNPSSLKKITQQNYMVEELAKQLYWHIEQQYLRLRTDNLALIRQHYLAELYRYNEPAWFELTAYNNEIVQAKIVDVAENGHLVLQFLDHNRAISNKFDIKEIKFLY